MQDVYYEKISWKSSSTARGLQSWTKDRVGEGTIKTETKPIVWVRVYEDTAMVFYMWVHITSTLWNVCVWVWHEGITPEYKCFIIVISLWLSPRWRRLYVLWRLDEMGWSRRRFFCTMVVLRYLYSLCWQILVEILYALWYQWWAFQF